MILRKLRTKLARTVGHFSPSSERFGPPHGICYSLRDWCQHHQARYTSVKSLGTENSPHELFAVELPNGRAFGKASVAVLTEDDQLLSEVSVAGFRDKIENHRLLRQFFLPRAHLIESDAAVIAVPGGNTYYHWLLDLLPRLEILRLAGWPSESIPCLIVNGHRRPFQRESLQRLGLAGKTISHEDFPHVKARRLIVPSFVGPREKSPAWVGVFLRQLFLKRAGTAQSGAARIYISRAKARSRTVTNDRDVMQLLERFGFTAVCLEELRVADQAAMFAHADWIVGTHGSGFANLVFCRPNTKIIEIFSHILVKDMYEHLAKQGGMIYRKIICKPGLPSAPPADPKAVTVDLPALEQALGAWA